MFYFFRLFETRMVEESANRESVEPSDYREDLGHLDLVAAQDFALIAYTKSLGKGGRFGD